MAQIQTSLDLTGILKTETTPLRAAIERLVIAGWTGRDADAMEAHIVELEKLGIARPKSTPIFYRVAAALLSTNPEIEIPGRDSSGEVEPVLVGIDGRTWLGVGSDHTDRKVEAIGITISKQLCAKPIGRAFWLFDDVADHWDRIVIRSFAIKDGHRRLYQEGPLAKMRTPQDLLSRYLGGETALPSGMAMFCGTMAVHGEIEPADAYDLEMEDPVLGRRLNHFYRVTFLPSKDEADPMPMNKPHLEFHGLDMDTGWQTPPGYKPGGVQEKILASDIDETAKFGSRTRLLRFPPGAFTTAPFVHDHWEEVFLVSGDLTVGNDAEGNGGEPFKAPTYACRPPGVWHGPFKSETGCLLYEVHYYDETNPFKPG